MSYGSTCNHFDLCLELHINDSFQYRIKINFSCNIYCEKSPLALLDLVPSYIWACFTMWHSHFHFSFSHQLPWRSNPHDTYMTFLFLHNKSHAWKFSWKLQIRASWNLIYMASYLHAISCEAISHSLLPDLRLNSFLSGITNHDQNTLKFDIRIHFSTLLNVMCFHIHCSSSFIFKPKKMIAMFH